MASLGISIEDLPVLALSRPADTAPVAGRVLAATRDPYTRSYAAQALGVATRERGDVARALRHLRVALAAAASVGGEREADVQATLGITLAYAGRSGHALRHLDAALSQASGVAAARIRLRRGNVFQMVGRTGEAIEEHRRASRTLRAAGDSIWEARALNNLGNALIDRGDARRADEALNRAEALLTDAGRTFDAAMVRSNRGLVAALFGKVPEALAHYDAAEKMYDVAGARPAELSQVRSAALLAVGLYADALHHGQEAVGLLRSQGASAAFRADALVRAAEAALAAGDPKLASTYATEAVRLFRRQGRERGETLARLEVVRARYATGERSRRLLREAAAVAATAERHRLAEASEAHLRAAQVALALGDLAAGPHLVRASRARSRGAALSRVLGWHAAALRAQAAGRRRAVFEACERGLQLLDAYQLTLGALEMRAAATAHGRALAEIAIREALAADEPRMLLRWTERWRATIFTIPPVRPPGDDELATELAVLRRLTRRLNEATAEGRATGALERERRRVEDEVRRRVLRTSGPSAEADSKRIDIDEVPAALGEIRLAEIVRFDGRLHVLVVTPAGVRRYAAGTWESAVREAEFSRFALRRLAYHTRLGTGRASLPAALAALEASAGRLQDQLLAGAVDELGGGPLVIVPPAALHPVPWGALPALADRAVTVAPSALTWLRGRGIEPPSDRAVAVVVGPGLEGGVAEAAALTDRYPDADVLAAGTATADKVLASLEGRWLAHIAAHGTFRADNPLFSSLAMADGPLTVHDLQRLRRAPYRLMLSCCDSGVTASAGADEMLGLIAALGQLGTAAVIAPVVAVNDAATVPLSLAVHERLAGGATASEALRDARRTMPDDPCSYAAARAYVAFGAA
ncbi:MAG TPA: CHAT domain-containing tetratricopeptide repeat protein [Streptosporangiaceae bacterium]|nr:CHAT domain-containing tetratricopeptide repeat protein [Streptosporangiaceae bacterium]